MADKKKTKAADDCAVLLCVRVKGTNLVPFGVHKVGRQGEAQAVSQPTVVKVLRVSQRAESDT